jgi:hypothetical protein
MKTVQQLLTGLALALAVLGADLASAQSNIHGKITGIGTISEVFHDGAYSARFVVRVHGNCDANPLDDRWVTISSGHMNDILFTHRSVNMRNTHSTLLAALLSGKTVDIGVSDCISNFVDLAPITGGVNVTLTD